MTAPLLRRLSAEFLGTALLVAIVVGSGIAAQRLSPDDVGLQLLQNSLTTVFGLAVLIVVLGPVSGAHFNPVVSLADWVFGRRSGSGLPGGEVAAYTVAQVVGAVTGAVLANTMFDRAPVEIAHSDRVTGGHLLGEIVATAGLIMTIFVLVRTRRTELAPITVAGWIGAAYWFTSSTSFANPAVTIGRIFSDSFAGISPGDTPPFIAAQIIGALAGLGLVAALYPAAADLDRPADATPSSAISAPEQRSSS